ncbi:hypothetical protein AA0119_g10896 [Alternaria tenuissima]|uniref:Uncharacterized protein n=1 Tax=Alternaria tenuissima TaxID=119927 RepID=A0A4V1WUA8_9PLEO|nr:hypothetical protein AA0114_g8253 [Alternaria tenuissima]RYN90513.1 hypothetical protein AA0120_g5815 [Alternaria tenuissima]RYN90929.1 hypothetical protein AA0119_g10896 [Alternaria tenuissima]RYO22233.1 hypothetical protein AA0121_g2808 [Alternaria tenuissima]
MSIFRLNGMSSGPVTAISPIKTTASKGTTPIIITPYSSTLSTSNFSAIDTSSLLSNKARLDVVFT